MAGLPEPSVQGTTSAKGQTTAVELSRAQQTIARRMAESKATIPHLTLQIDVSMDDCLTLQAELQTVTHSDMIVKACALALREHPIANGRYRDGRLQLHSRVNVGFTVTSPGTLLVPTVFDADQKSLPEIAGERSALAERAHAGTISPSELSGATFTVSDLGSHGVRSFAAVIIPPQVAILSIGAVEPRVVAVARDRHSPVEMIARRVVTLTLSCDHRVLYGADAAQFLARIGELLEAPAALAV
jgi:pyruvate dehydrogenase E2 component (dihydrolipoamide acetyltransferase)